MTPEKLDELEQRLDGGSWRVDEALDLIATARREAALREALMALRAEVVKLDDLRRDVGSAEAMNHRIIALIDAALEPTP